MVNIASNEMVGAAKASNVGGAYQITVGAAMNITVGLSHSEQTDLKRSVIAGSNINVSCGAASIMLEKNGNIALQG